MWGAHHPSTSTSHEPQTSNSNCEHLKDVKLNKNIDTFSSATQAHPIKPLYRRSFSEHPAPDFSIRSRSNTLPSYASNEVTWVRLQIRAAKIQAKEELTQIKVNLLQIYELR